MSCKWDEHQENHTCFHCGQMAEARRWEGSLGEELEGEKTHFIQGNKVRPADCSTGATRTLSIWNSLPTKKSSSSPLGSCLLRAPGPGRECPQGPVYVSQSQVGTSWTELQACDQSSLDRG